METIQIMQTISFIKTSVAVACGILVCFSRYAAVKPHYQTAAFIASLLSVVSLIWLESTVGGYNTQIARVFYADLIALISLIIGAAAHIYQQRQG